MQTASQRDTAKEFFGPSDFRQPVNIMKNSEEEIFIDLSMVKSADTPIYSVINHFFVLLIVIGLIFLFILLSQQPILIGGIIFIIFYIVFFAIVWYQTSRIIIKLQLSTNGARIQTLTTIHHYSASCIDKLLLEHFFSWIVFHVIKVSTKRNINIFLYPYDVSGIAPMYYEANLKYAIAKYNKYISNGRPME